MSTANDMARWMSMLLNDGNINGTQVVEPEVIRETMITHTAREDSNIPRDVQRPRYPHFKHGHSDQQVRL